MMSDKYLNIILISSDWGDNHRKGLHIELSKKLSVWSETVFIEYPYSVVIHTLYKFKSRFLKFLHYGMTKNYDPVTVYTPFILFHDKIWKMSKLAFKIDSFFLERQISRFVKKNFPEYYVILWSSSPYHYLFTKKFKHDFLIYDYYDNYSFNIDGSFNKESDELNMKMIKDSRMILCTAKNMLDRSVTINKNSYYIPNGHNFDLNKIKNTQRVKIIENAEIIGYIGNIRDWIDFSLIDKLLKNMRPHQHLVFVGPVEKNVLPIINKFKNNSNFKHIEKVPYEETWKYIKGFDVGIIPFKINKFTEGVLPYKFFEYIACDIPVVSTSLPDLEQYKNIINVSYSDSEFIDFCINVRHKLTDIQLNEYSEIAINSKWEKRAETINQLLIKEVLI